MDNPAKPSALYLDTSILFRENWPRFSKKLTDLLDLCARLDVRVVIPSVVAQELRTQIQRAWLDQQQSVATGLRKLNSRLSDAKRSALALPTIEEVIADFDAQHSSALQAHHITIAELPGLTLKEAVELSATYQEPFRSEDSGFRDSVIVLTVKAHMGANGLSSAILLMQDNRVEGLTSYLASIGVVHLSEVAQAIDQLKTHLQANFLADLTARNEEVKSALQLRQSELEDHLRKTLRVPAQAPGFAGEIVNVRDIKLVEVVSVTTGIDIKPIQDTHVSASTELKVEVSCEAAILQLTPPPFLAVGSAATSSSAPSDLVSYEDVTVPMKVTANFEVWRSGAGAFEFTFGEAFVGDALTEMVRRIVWRTRP